MVNRLLWFIALTFISIFLLVSVITPAFSSLRINCQPGGVNIDFEETSNVAGIFLPETQEILINPLIDKESDFFKTIFKHEFTHFKQFQRGTAINCSLPLSVLLAEAEAYLAQGFPDNLYERVYKTTLPWRT